MEEQESLLNKERERERERESMETFPLFETKPAKGRLLLKVYAASIFVCICFIFVHRVRYLPAEEEIARWSWIGLFCSEIWFSFYWFITIVVRWNPVYRRTFKQRLSQRYEKVLPKVDIFVCTADHVTEPPVIVINTILSVMAYDYPPEKLCVYLSDDGCSDLTFYALLEASGFAKIWLPFCRKLKVEPRSPDAYFRTVVEPIGDPYEWWSVKRSFEDMKNRIETATKLGRIPEDISKSHKGFLEWDSVSSPRDHQTILQILFYGSDPGAVDIEGRALPTLIYLAREKRPQYHHNFKAGAMNALIRVSSRISNAPIILNVDCDMYSNNSESIRDAMCFFMDEDEGHNVAYVQFPQSFEQITKNDLYNNSLGEICEVELPGFDGNGGPCYIGTNCFHRRDALSGKKYSTKCKIDWKSENAKMGEDTSSKLADQTCKVLASCGYEENTEWGKEMGLMYGSLVEDVLTGLSIQCRGWRSIYFIPERKGFLGLAPKTLLQSLVQHKRWSEGDMQILLSRYSPFIYGHKRIPLTLQLSYCNYVMWAINSLPTVYYVTVPSLSLLKGISLFPKITSPWVLPFAYAFCTNCAYSLGDFISRMGTFRGWWNAQRMWMFKRTTSYFFGFSDAILKLLGFTKSAFTITVKTTDEDVFQRYEQEVMEFGTHSSMFSIIGTLALLNFFSFVGGMKRVIMDAQFNQLALQILLCGLVVVSNVPVYKGQFLRKDNGRMPASITYQSIFLALLACSVAMY